MLALPYLAYITVDLNPADWAASIAQLAEHWASNPVVTGSNPVRGSSVFFHCLPSDFALLAFPCFNLHIQVQCTLTTCSKRNKKRKFQVEAKSGKYGITLLKFFLHFCTSTCAGSMLPACAGSMLPACAGSMFPAHSGKISCTC